MHKHLTDKSIERIKPPAAGQIDVFDQGYPGLGLRISYGGRKAWFYVYRHQAKQKRLNLGTFPEVTLDEARDGWRDAREALKAGRDPAAMSATAVQQSSDKFSDVLDDWLKRDQGENRTHYEIQRLMKRETKAWSDRPIGSITRADVRAVLDSIAERGALTMSRRCQSHLHTLFGWAAGI